MKTSTFALIVGLVYLAAGLLGLIPAMLMPPPIDAPPTTFAVLYGYLLGLFPMNIIHSLAHVVIGAWGLAAWSGRATGGTYARSLAVIFGVLAVLGVLPTTNTLFGMMPIGSHEVWLHGSASLANATNVGCAGTTTGPSKPCAGCAGASHPTAGSA